MNYLMPSNDKFLIFKKQKCEHISQWNMFSVKKEKIAIETQWCFLEEDVVAKLNVNTFLDTQLWISECCPIFSEFLQKIDK